jgi:hypothetical protein
MTTFTVETRSQARQLYTIEADSLAEARGMAERREGLLIPDLTEVFDVEIIDVTEDDC